MKVSSPRFSLLLVLSCVVSLSFASPTHALPAPGSIMISDSGQNLISIFDGLKPTPALQVYATFHTFEMPWPSLTSNRLPASNRLPGLRFVQHFIGGGGNCPSSVCSGHFNVFVVSGGCGALNCNPVFNANSSADALCQTGTMDHECGDGVVCCANAQQCLNTRGCF
jgi:hypothetical protein